MGLARTLPQERSQLSVTSGCSSREVPKVSAKPHPAGLSKETVLLLGQEPSVQAIICCEGGLANAKALLVLSRRKVSSSL